MINEDETLDLVKQALKLMKPSLAEKVLYTLVLLGPIGKLMLDIFDKQPIQTYILLLSIICMAAIIITWITYIFAMKKYKIYCNMEMEKFTKLLSDENL